MHTPGSIRFLESHITKLAGNVPHSVATAAFPVNQKSCWGGGGSRLPQVVKHIVQHGLFQQAARQRD